MSPPYTGKPARIRTRVPRQHRRNIIHLIIQNDPSIVLSPHILINHSHSHIPLAHKGRTFLLCFAISSSENVFSVPLLSSLLGSSAGLIHPPPPFPGATGWMKRTTGPPLSGSSSSVWRTRYHELLNARRDLAIEPGWKGHNSLHHALHGITTSVQK